MTVDIDLDQLAQVIFVRVVSYKITLFPLSMLYFLERNYYAILTLNERGVIFQFYESKVYTENFCILLNGEFISSLAFLILIIY